MEKRVSKISLLLAFWISCIGYSFWGILWKDAFYQLIALSFVLYTFAIFHECTKDFWKKTTYVFFVASVNNFVDEITKRAIVFDWTEYTSVLFMFGYIFRNNINKLINKLRLK